MIDDPDSTGQSVSPPVITFLSIFQNSKYKNKTSTAILDDKLPVGRWTIFRCLLTVFLTDQRDVGRYLLVNKTAKPNGVVLSDGLYSSG